jgi:hypothetical protein
MDGIQVGTDLYRTQREQFGILFGYEGGNATVANDWVKADDLYVGIYGARVLRSGTDIRGNTTEINLELGKHPRVGGRSRRIRWPSFPPYSTPTKGNTHGKIHTNF